VEIWHLGGLERPFGGHFGNTYENGIILEKKCQQ
jgi:hypothetical protein